MKIVDAMYWSILNIYFHEFIIIPKKELTDHHQIILGTELIILEMGT